MGRQQHFVFVFSNQVAPFFKKLFKPFYFIGRLDLLKAHFSSSEVTFKIFGFHFY